MPDPTPVALRLADKLHDAIHVYVNTQDLPVARQVFAHALDEAGVREAVSWLEEGFLSDEDGKDDCMRRALSALTGTKEVSDE